MAADRGDRPRPETAMQYADQIAACARRRGGEAGRLRRRQFEITLVVAAQCGLAATLSWGLAHEVLDRPSPIFAPSAAVGTIVAALGQRARRTAELLLGVGLGLFIGDLLLLYIGFGPWQIGLVVALAIAVALLLTGKSGALVGQAGSSAVLIATMAQSREGLEWARIVDAVVGAIVGLVVVAVLIPFNPIRILDRAAAPLTEALNAQLREVPQALAQRDPDRAVRALGRLRGMDPDLARLHEALDGAEEATTIAPVRWHRRADVERYEHCVLHDTQETRITDIIHLDSPSRQELACGGRPANGRDIKGDLPLPGRRPWTATATVSRATGRTTPPTPKTPRAMTAATSPTPIAARRALAALSNRAGSGEPPRQPGVSSSSASGSWWRIPR